jgi:hypothetical protein
MIEEMKSSCGTTMIGGPKKNDAEGFGERETGGIDSALIDTARNLTSNE